MPFVLFCQLLNAYSYDTVDKSFPTTFGNKTTHIHLEMYADYYVLDLVLIVFYFYHIIDWLTVVLDSDSRFFFGKNTNKIIYVDFCCISILHYFPYF